MNNIIAPEIKEIIEAVHYRPAVSILMPFEPKMTSKTQILHSLKMITNKLELELLENYPSEICTLIMHKVKALFSNLNFHTHKKSIAVYISPVFEKVLYLDINVEEKMLIDESFEIRDLVYSKKRLKKYLVLLLGMKGSRMFLADSMTFVHIISDTPKYTDQEKGIPERVANFSDKSSYKETMMHKYLHHMENTLDIILNAYQLPLFVLGTEKILGHFKNLTKHNSKVIDYVHGNYEESTLPELKEVLEPCIKDWKNVMQRDLLNQLEEAAGKKKLATGMLDVWREASDHKGRLLVVEKSYMYEAEHGSTDEIIYKAIEPYNKFSCIKDAVDDVIEKVLENGGDVEFVDEGVLSSYQQIALIQYY